MALRGETSSNLDSLLLIWCSQLSLITERLNKLVVSSIGAQNDFLEATQDVYERVDRRKLYITFCAKFSHIQDHPELIKFVKKLQKQNDADYELITRRINEHVEKVLLCEDRLEKLKEQKRKLKCSREKLL